MPVKSNPIETTELCNYGCGKQAKFINNSGRLMCCASHTSCDANKQKNRDALKFAYDCGKRKSQKQVYAELSDEKKRSMNWNKGLTKNDHPSIAKSCEKLSKSATGRIVSEETRNKLSKKRIEYLENSPHVKWFEINGIKFQGSWEAHVAKILFDYGFNIERRRIYYDGVRRYTPDFYIKELDVYLEVKGYLYDTDRLKYRKVLDEHPDKIIKVLYKEKTVFNFDASKILDLPDLNSIL